MAVCNKCGGDIEWKRIGSRWYALDLDGSEHFDTCSRLRMEKIRREGTPFTEDSGEGYRHHGKDHFTRRSGQFIIGHNYVKKYCAAPCNIPPWEHCACSSSADDSDDAHLSKEFALQGQHVRDIFNRRD